jgi:ParB family chromosome partitioning protein
MAKKIDVTNSINNSNFLNAAKGAALSQDLGALLRNEDSTNIDYLNNKILLKLNEIEENPFQPRIEIKEESLKELANSIEKEGLLQPILVQQFKNKYIVIAGHRRLFAHRLLKRDNIWASIINEKYSNSVDNSKLLFRKAMIENIQRDQLFPLEFALSCNHAMEKKLYSSKEALAKAINKSKSYVIKVMSILKLSQVIIDDLNKNRSVNDVESLYELQKIKDIKKQEKLYFELIDKKITREDIRREAKNNKPNKERILYKKTKTKIAISFDLNNFNSKQTIEIEEEINKLLSKYK